MHYEHIIATMERKGSWVILLATVSMLSYEYAAYGLPDGAPEQACSTLAPDHPKNEPQDCDTEDCRSLFALRVLEIDSEPVQPETVTYRCGASHTGQFVATRDAESKDYSSNPIGFQLIKINKKVICETNEQ